MYHCKTAFCIVLLSITVVFDIVREDGSIKVSSVTNFAFRTVPAVIGYIKP